MQYTCPDLMHAVNGISCYDSAQSAPASQGINHLIRYIDGFPHCPIMYPAGLYDTITHDLHQEVSQVDFYSQKIFNGLVSFAYVGEGRTPNYKRSIAYVIPLFYVAINWADKTQPAYVSHYTDSEVRTFYIATKMIKWPQPILQNLGFQFSDIPTPICEDIQPKIDIIKANHITSRIKHIYAPFHYVHEIYVLITIGSVKLNTTIIP